MLLLALQQIRNNNAVIYQKVQYMTHYLSQLLSHEDIVCVYVYDIAACKGFN